MKHRLWRLRRLVPRRCHATWPGGRCGRWVWREPGWRHGHCDDCMPF